MQPRRSRVLLGVLLWCGVAGAAAMGVASLDAGERSQATAALHDLWRLRTGGAREIAVVFPGAVPWLEKGDGLYLQGGTDDLELVRVGQVSAVLDQESGRAVALEVDPAVAPRLTAAARVTAFSSGASLSWTYRSLLPVYTREMIKGQWSAFLAENEALIRDIALPLAHDLAGALIAEALDEAAAVLARHRPELAALARRYRAEILEARVVPVLEREVWPIAKKEAGPVLTAIGRELWQALPLASLTWRGVWDKFGFEHEKRLKIGFEAFLEEEALPILAKHGGEVDAAVRAIVREAVDNDEVADVAREALLEIVTDPELRSIGRTMLEEFVRSPRFAALIKQHLEDPARKAGVDELRARFDELFRSTGRRMVLDPEGNIRPDFARFIRTLVLKKDRHWMLLELDAAGAPLEPLEQGARIVGTVSPD